MIRTHVGLGALGFAIIDNVNVVNYIQLVSYSSFGQWGAECHPPLLRVFGDPPMPPVLCHEERI